MTVMARTSKKTQSVEEPNKMPIAYFLSLEVENFLCFKDKQVLDLCDKNGNPAQWTVILGDNGVGKTTLLRCIAGMSATIGESKKEIMPIFYHPIYHFNGLSERGNSFQVVTSSDWVIKADLAFGSKLTWLNPNLSNYKKFKKRPISCSFEQFRSHIDTFDINLSNVNSSDNDYYDFPGLICYGYGATRRVGKPNLSEQHYQENSASLFLENTSLINAEEWLLQTDYSSKYSEGKKQEDLHKQINSLKDIFKRVLPDVEDIDIFLQDHANGRPHVKFKMPYGWIPFVDMGLGYKTMMTWILDLVIRLYKRYPESDDPLSEPTIVLVDEIDLHLHPKWQRTIMDFLTKRFPNTQFIVTAHSPLVVQAAQDANIVLLRREGDRVVIDNNPEIIDNWRVDQILTSLFELPSARPATLDPLLKRREEILTKPKLTPKDKAELKASAEQIGHLPTGETPEDIQAMDIIRRAAKLLENQQKSDSHS